MDKLKGGGALTGNVPKFETGAKFSDKIGMKSDVSDIKEISTDKIKPWKHANRDENEIVIEELAELIESTGQKVPALVRPSKHVPGEFELIYGRRRLEACKKLNIKLVCIVKQLSDTEAFEYMTMENKDRHDISYFSYCLSYKNAIDDGLFKNVSKLAESVGVQKDRTTVSKMIAVARNMPAELVSVLDNLVNVSSASIEVILDLIKDQDRNSETYQAILELAEDIATGKLKSGNIRTKVEWLLSGSSANKSSSTQYDLCGGKVTVSYTTKGALNLRLSKELSGKFTEEELIEKLQSIL